MLRRIPPALLALVLAACGGGPNPTLTLNIDALPGLTNQSSVTVAGTVVRSPEGNKAITISVAGGQNAVLDSLVGGTTFSFSIRLNANAENQLVVTASDADGAISQPAILVIRHDDMGPAVLDMTPSPMSTDAPLGTPIEVFFAEPLLAGAGASIILRQNQVPVMGAATISPDGQRVTYVPAEPLQPNSVYELDFTGYTDQTGNAAAPGACFLTTASGFPLSATQDTTDVGWQLGAPSGSLLELDVVSTRMARRDSTLFATIEFGRPRVFADPQDTSALVFIEIDADQAEGTGFTSFRDTIFRDFPELDSHLGVEYLVGIEPDPSLGDSAYVGLYTGPLRYNILDTFRPGVCGPYYGFHTTVLFDSMGDDGQFDFTVMGLATSVPGNFVDIMPENGHLTADLRALVPAFTSYRSDLLRRRQNGPVGDLSNWYERIAAPARRR